MELYAGIDLHGNNSVVTVLDEQDRTVYAKRVPNDLDAIVASLRACAGTVRGAWFSSGCFRVAQANASGPQCSAAWRVCLAI